MSKPEYNKGIKSGALGKSRFVQEKPDKEEFERKSAEIFEDEQKAKTKIAELSSRFVSFIKDKTLPENKSPIQIDLEKDVSRQLTNAALVLNNDENQPEGTGSVGCVLLLFNVVLKQRDFINEQSFKISNLEKEIELLKKRFDNE